MRGGTVVEMEVVGRLGCRRSSVTAAAVIPKERSDEGSAGRRGSRTADPSLTLGMTSLLRRIGL
jgi:hypothetical protein